jgi:hemolysin activation/secretion protein
MNYVTNCILSKNTIFLVFLSINAMLYGASDREMYSEVPSLSHIVISDSEQKIDTLKPKALTNKILIIDVSKLNTKEFSDLLEPYFKQHITSDLINKLTADITTFLRKRGEKLVNVFTPRQILENGTLKIVVVIGRYSLARLYLSSIEKCIEPYPSVPSSSQIVLNGLDDSIGTPALAKTLAPYFAKPITPDSVNSLIMDLSNYFSSHGQYLAEAQVPDQNAHNGILNIGIKLGKYPLKKLIINDSEKTAKDILKRTKSTSQKIEANGSIIFNTKEFNDFLEHYFGLPITVNLLSQLRSDLISYGKNHDRPLIDSTTPIIDLKNGEIRITLIIGHYNKLHLKGNYWFSDELLIKKLGIKSGDEIKSSDLDTAFNWANQNPFRQVQLIVDTLGKPQGEADLDVQIQEVFPFKFVVSYSNALNSPLGNSAYSASMQMGNLWGLDHEINYQFSTNNTPKYDQSHSLDYKAPLPWHDVIRFDLAYSLVEPRSLLGYVGLNEVATNVVSDITYTKSIQKGLWTFGESFGLDYKQIHTNLTFGEYVQPITNYDVFQIATGGSIMKKDYLGNWNLGANVCVSPGSFNSRNTDIVYGQVSSGGQTGRVSKYVYGRLVLERDTNLPLGMQWVSRAQIQLSTTNLEGSEEITIGGGSTVRGYNENLSGDQGWIINQEFRSPNWQTYIPFLRKKSSRIISTQLLSFIDYGRVSYKHLIPSDIVLPPLMGAGLGLRINLTGHFSFSADLGWRLLKPLYTEDRHMRGSFSGSLAY